MKNITTKQSMAGCTQVTIPKVLTDAQISALKDAIGAIVKDIPLTKVFPFLKLPPELREVVYEQVFSPNDIEIWAIKRDGQMFPKATKWIGKNRSAILKTSWNIYKEALPVLYGRSNFVFPLVARLKWFAEKNGHNFINYLTTVTITDQENRAGFASAMHYLAYAKHLKTIRIQVWIGDFGSHYILGHKRLMEGLVKFVGTEGNAAAKLARFRKLNFDLVAWGAWTRGNGLHQYSSQEAIEGVKDDLRKAVGLT